MRKVDYVTLIKESLSELKLLEQQQSKARLRLRVQLLRLLKSQTVLTLKQASAILGISAKHAYHLWHRYREQGLVAFLQLNYQAKAAKLKPEEQEKLIKQAQAQGFQSQHEAKEWIEKHLGQHYTQQGVSLLFQRFKIKAKTARPANVKANPQEQSEYKKSFRNG
jgi:transposase